MNEFISSELQRIITKIPETDPATTEYHILLQSLECFAGIADLIEEAQEQIGMEGQIIHVEFRPQMGGAHPVDEEKPSKLEAVSLSDFAKMDIPKPEGYDEQYKDEEVWHEEAVKAEAEKTYEMTEVRAALVEARKRGVNVSALLKEFGVDNFGAFPAGKYGELMKKLEK